jgi:hypothetical protein
VNTRIRFLLQPNLNGVIRTAPHWQATSIPKKRTRIIPNNARGAENYACPFSWSQLASMSIYQRFTKIRADPWPIPPLRLPRLGERPFPTHNSLTPASRLSAFFCRNCATAFAMVNLVQRPNERGVPADDQILSRRDWPWAPSGELSREASMSGRKCVCMHQTY